MIQDFRLAFRSLAKTPGFTFVAIVTVALAIGANSTVFSLVNALLIRPLPYKNPQELLLLWEKFSAQGLDQIPVSAPEYLDYAKELRSLEAGAQMYVPHAQDAGWGFMALVIRPAGEPASMAPAVRREVLNIDKDQPIYNVRTMEDAVAESMGTRRASTLLFAVFAGAALILAAVGIYGVMAYSVTQRTQEIGIRMALGAQTGDVLRLVVRQGMVLTLIGIAVGLAGSLGLAKVIASLLFDVPATDPATFVGIPLLILLVALIACYLPALRAARLDPTIALASQ